MNKPIFMAFLILATPFVSAAAANRNECGAYALHRSLGILGIQVEYGNLRDKLGITENEGTTFLQMYEVAQEMGAIAEAVSFDVEGLLLQDAPCILFVHNDHFIAIGAYDTAGRRVYVLDQDKDGAWLPVKELGDIWRGEALIIRAAESHGYPRLWVDSYLLNFGHFYGVNGESRQITLLNTGDEPLEFGNVEYSCHCVEATFEPPVIPPRSFGTAKLMFDTSLKRPGRFSVRMFVHTNEPQNQPRGFELSGEVDRTLVLNPAYFSLGDFDPSAGRMELTSNLILGEEYRGKVWGEGGSPVLSWISAVKSADGGRFEIKVAFDPSKAETDENGRFLHRLFVATDHPQYQLLELAVRGRRLPCVSVMPKQVFLQQCRPGEVLRRYVKVVALCEPLEQVVVGDPSIARARLDNGQITLDVTAPSVAGGFQTWVRLVGKGTNVTVAVRGVTTTQP